jgi:hypothetical protein
MQTPFNPTAAIGIPDEQCLLLSSGFKLNLLLDAWKIIG